MRDVWGGWIIRYLHRPAHRCSFLVVYLHMFRALLYGSYRKPRELVWIVGMLIFLCLMAEAFFGYLPAVGPDVVLGCAGDVNLFDAIPLVGPTIAVWIRGDYVVSDATLNRFFGISCDRDRRWCCLEWSPATHTRAARGRLQTTLTASRSRTRKTRPAGRSTASRSIRTTRSKDTLGAAVFPDRVRDLHLLPARDGWLLPRIQQLQSRPTRCARRPHIAPLWYFTPYYSILRAITETFMWVLGAGVIGMVR